MNRRGFSLLEVVVALTILAMVCTVAFRGISASLKTIARIELADQRLEQVRSKLAELDLCGPFREGDHAEGRFDDGSRWRVDTSNWIPPTQRAPGAVMRITLQVEWEGRNGVQKREIASYRFVQNLGALPRPLEDQ